MRRIRIYSRYLPRYCKRFFALATNFPFVASNYFPHPPRIQWTLSIRPPMDQRHLAVITGDRINEGFFASYYVWPFCRAAKKSGRNNEVTVLPRWPLDEIWLYRRTENFKEVKKLISCWKYGGTPLKRSLMGQTNLAVLTGDRINKGFFARKCIQFKVDRLPGGQKEWP